MTDLLELAAKVEGLQGPDREVDADILMALGMDKPYAGTVTAINYPVSYRIGNGMTAKQAIAAGCPKRLIAAHYKAPAFTASLDAAMTLVPEGFSMQVSANPASAYATVVDPLMEDETDLKCLHAGEGKTPALALTAAALRAIEDAGWKVVPVSPTDAMMEAGDGVEVDGISLASPGDSDYIWSAMLDAAPTPTAAPSRGDRP